MLAFLFVFGATLLAVTLMNLWAEEEAQLPPAYRYAFDVVVACMTLFVTLGILSF